MFNTLGHNRDQKKSKHNQQMATLQTNFDDDERQAELERGMFIEQTVCIKFVLTCPCQVYTGRRKAAL